MSKLEWKVIEVEGHELETTLCDLTEKNYEVFNVQYTNPLWTIIARKGVKEIQPKTMGFGKGA